MRFISIVLAVCLAVSGAGAADAFLGDWKLNPQKSNFAGWAVKDSRALIDLANGGEYLQFSETIFSDASRPLRFAGEMRSGGAPGEGTLDGRPVRYSTKKFGQNIFEITITD